MSLLKKTYGRFFGSSELVNETPSSFKMKRSQLVLQPDQSRVLLRSFNPGDADRVARIVKEVLAIPETMAATILENVMIDFSSRHKNLNRVLQERFDLVYGDRAFDGSVSEQKRLLIGSCFLAEYSLESAALFNPSVVPHMDQARLPAGALRFILSLRATGEGHISSITFRTGVLQANGEIEIEEPDGFLTEAKQVPNSLYQKDLFVRKLDELGLGCDFSKRVSNQLGSYFTIDELDVCINTELRSKHCDEGMLHKDHQTAHGIRMLAQSNYEVQFDHGEELSQRILFPVSPSQRNGIEDARFVHFRNADDSHLFYATFTAYDGSVVMPELIETTDFCRFRFSTLNGPAARNKGMALFPRKINGRYAMLTRHDNESIFLSYSDNIHFWNSSKLLIKPAHYWEAIQIGNCGSPIETEAGWLVLSHGVGPMRKYCIGAFLLDLDDPGKVIGRLSEPLLQPNESERKGYVPNVVYTCGALVHNDFLFMPYGVADNATAFATVPIKELLNAMQSNTSLLK